MSERKIRAGDHLWVQRLGYEHHGLASGPGTVIQYSGKDGVFDTGVIEEVSLAKFAKRRKVRLKEHAERLHNRKKSVQRARERIGEKKYNLVFNNCEQFVNWCIQGEHTSEQVNSVAQGVLVGGSVYLAKAAYTARNTDLLLTSGRTLPTVVKAANSARVAASLAPAVSTTLASTASGAAASITPIASGLGAAGLATTLGGVGAAALGVVSAPVSVPALAVASGLAIAATAVGSLWKRWR